MPQKNWNPTDYDNQSVLQYNTAISMLNDVPLAKNARILDVGCGTGKITHEIAKNRTPAGAVLGIDINAHMVNFAREHYRAPNLRFECLDVLAMKYEGCFDVAVSFWTLSWIALRDQLRALENIIKSLAENGNLILMYPLKHDAYAVVNDVIKRPRWQKYFTNYEMPRSFITEEQYKLIISRIPEELMKVSVVKKEIECRYKDEQEMISSINCWLAHVDEIPLEEEKKAFLAEVAQAYKAHRMISHPTMYYSTLEITGTKISLEQQLLITCRL
jgi:trans-aconitate methyltransferase